jgi:hypothetical protein
MTTPSIAFTPMATTNAAGLFSLTESGLVQGIAHPDPSSRNFLAQGYLSSTETLPMWGGVGIYENVPLSTGDQAVGGQVGRATSLSTLTGFSVFDQAVNGLSSPQSEVPQYATGMTVNFYRLKSGARIAVACDPALVSLDGGLISQQVSWDYTAQRLVAYTPAYSAATITGATWANTSGGRTTFTVGTDLSATLSAGSTIDVSGVVSTGGSGVGFNGSFVVVSVTSTTVVVTQALSTSPGTYSSGGSIAAGGGALPVTVLRVIGSGCKTVNYNAATNQVTWNNNGACALIQI